MWNSNILWNNFKIRYQFVLFLASNPVKIFYNIYLYFEWNHDTKFEILTLWHFVYNSNISWNNLIITHQFVFKNYVPASPNKRIILGKIFAISTCTLNKLVKPNLKFCHFYSFKWNSNIFWNNLKIRHQFIFKIYMPVPCHKKIVL